MDINENNLIKIGQIGVDAGICWIGDPCYILHQENGLPKDIGNNWTEFCDRLDRKGFYSGNHIGVQFNYDGGYSGLGVVSTTGFGDGIYDVFAEIEDRGAWGKRVKRIIVEFIPDEAIEDNDHEQCSDET